MFCNCLDAQLVTSIENKMNISNTSKKGEVHCTGNNKCPVLHVHVGTFMNMAES